MDRKSIEIPTRDGSEVVEVFLDELPENAEELCEILYSEMAPIELFHQFALEYYKRNKKLAFSHLIKRGLSESKHRKTPSSSAMVGRLYSTLAAHYISEGLTCSNKSRCNEYFEEATSCLNEAERSISSTEEFGLRKGLLLLAKNSTYEVARYQFKHCLDRTPNSIPALIGQACVLFFSEQFRPALAAFQAILKSCPQFNDIRLAIGLCFQRLGYLDMAKRAFANVLEIDPQNETALLGIGFINLTGPDLQAGLLNMKQVYQLNKTNAVAQIHLANHFFFKKDLEKAKLLASSALSSAPSDKIRGEAHFILAKISHSSGNFVEALTQYQMSIKLSPSFLPSIYGLGQCLLARGDYDGSIMMFEKVYNSQPGCPEVIRILSLLYMAKLAKIHITPESNENDKQRSDVIDKALSLSPVALKLFPGDRLLQMVSAVLFEDKHAETSIKLYEATHISDSKNFAAINNYVILKSHQSPDWNGSVELLQKAADLFKTTAPETDIINLYLIYSRARIIEEHANESESSSSSAVEMYKSILKINSSFTQAHLRLGIMCFNRNQLSEAADHFKDVLGNDDKNPIAWNLLASTHLKQKAFTPARKAFERILQSIDKNDTYALISLGNIYTELARQDKTKRHTDDYHRRAGEFFGKALSLDRGNIFAAQGMAVILAHRNQIFDAKEVFNLVRSAMEEKGNALHKELLDCTLNLAHSLVELGQFAGAVSLYTLVIKSYEEGSLSSGKLVALLLYACRARYLLASESGDWKVLNLALEDCRQALQTLPSDEPLKFNLALLLQERAAIIKVRPEAVESNLLEAAENIHEAEGIFREMSAMSSSKMDLKLVSSHMSQCSVISKGIRERCELNEKSLKEQHERLEQLRIQRSIQQQRDAELAAQREATERQKSLEIELIRREMTMKMKETEEKISKVTILNKKNQNSSDSEEISDSEGLRVTKRRKRMKSGMSAKALRSEEEGQNDADEDDDMDGIVGSGSRRARRKTAKNLSEASTLLSKEFISSEDEEEVEANEDEKASII